MREKKSWIVVGAGPQGTHLVCCLLDQGVEREELLLLDDCEEPLSRWTRRTEKLRMGYLRSTAVHHLDISPWSQATYAGQRYGRESRWSAPPYRRPKYSVFQEHCHFVLDKFDIPSVFRQGRVLAVERLKSKGFFVRTDGCDFQARNVVLALGQPPPHVPDWARRSDACIRHLLDADAPLGDLGGRIVVVGAGMTGAQFSLACCDAAEQVTLLCSGPVKVEDFDADPCWLGPKCVNSEFSGSSPECRRSVISAARNPGTVNPQVYEQLNSAVRAGKLEIVHSKATGVENGRLQLDSGDSLPYDELFLATGFEKCRPGGQLVADMVEKLQLPVGLCGYPLTTSRLEWAPGLFVMGGLAELTLGPIARNIPGARSAAKRILQAVRATRKRPVHAVR